MSQWREGLQVGAEMEPGVLLRNQPCEDFRFDVAIGSLLWSIDAANDDTTIDPVGGRTMAGYSGEYAPTSF